MKKGKQTVDNTATVETVAATDTKKRGRKPGVTVQSKDYRAAKALKHVRFEEFFGRMTDDDGTGEWRDDLIDAIIATLRERDIF